MCVPHRFDLIDSSCVNKQVCSINRKLEKLVKNCNYISVIKIDLSRGYFKNPGLHLNTLGKERLTKQLATSINSILQLKEGVPISVGWMFVHMITVRLYR
jgi:hypothetical protein